MSKSYIVSMNVNGLSMKVPEEDSRYIVYADPEDPGATDLYEASFVIAMPKNMDNEQHHEMFVLNGKVVNINQQPNDIPYIILDHDFDNVTSENGQVVIDIKSIPSMISSWYVALAVMVVSRSRNHPSTWIRKG